MLARIHSLLGLGVLGGFLLHHAWRLWPAQGGPRVWVLSHPEVGSRMLPALMVAGVLVVHGVLGVVRQRSRAAGQGEAAGAGLSRLQLVTGVLVLAFVAYHLSQVWAHVAGPVDAPHAGPHDVYATLWQQLGRPVDLVIYIVGVSSACFHVGHGISRLPATWTAAGAAGPGARQRLAWRLSGGLVGIALWLALLQVLGTFALGEPMLRFGDNPLQQLVDPGVRR